MYSVIIPALLPQCQKTVLIIKSSQYNFSLSVSLSLPVSTYDCLLGGGYVLSKEALTRFANKGFHNNAVCREDGGAEDAEFGKCKYYYNWLYL